MEIDGYHDNILSWQRVNGRGIGRFEGSSEHPNMQGRRGGRPPPDRVCLHLDGRSVGLHGA